MQIPLICPDKPLEGGIIAGGLGTRMGGADKGLIQWRERYFAEHISEILKPHVQRLLVNCNRNHSAYEELADVTISDGLDTFEGPLQGLSVLLEACQTDWIIVTPCDTPRLPRDFVSRMVADARAHPGHLVIVDDGSRLHPLHMLVPTVLKSDLRDYLARGQRRVMQWVKQYPLVQCDFSDCPECFENVNSPELLDVLNTRKPGA